MLQRIVITVLVIHLLTACGIGGGSIPGDHFYRVPAVSLPAQSTPALDEVLVKPVKVSGLLHDRAILYVELDKPLELQRYHYNFWAESPANLVQNALYQGFTSAAVATQVIRERGSSRPELVLSSHLRHFERHIDGSDVSAEVELDVTLSSATRPELNWSKTYRSSQAVNSLNMHDSANAFGTALESVASQLLDDILVKK